MSMSPQQIETGALGLPANERARLARRLIQSLDEEIEDPAEVERAWKTELQLRLDEYRAAKVQTTPAAEVFPEATPPLVNPVPFLPAAREEFFAAAKHYEAVAPGLGHDFIKAVEKAVARLSRLPGARKSISFGDSPHSPPTLSFQRGLHRRSRSDSGCRGRASRPQARVLAPSRVTGVGPLPPPLVRK